MLRYGDPPDLHQHLLLFIWTMHALAPKQEVGAEQKIPNLGGRTDQQEDQPTDQPAHGRLREQTVFPCNQRPPSSFLNLQQ